MCFCGDKSNGNEESILINDIRRFDGMETNMQLGKYSFTFNPNNGHWKAKIPQFNVYQEPAELEEIKTEIEAQKQEDRRRDDELERLETVYLAKYAKLNILIQTHCEIKREIEDLVNEYKGKSDLFTEELIEDEEVKVNN